MADFAGIVRARHIRLSMWLGLLSYWGKACSRGLAAPGTHNWIRRLQTPSPHQWLALTSIVANNLPPSKRTHVLHPDCSGSSWCGELGEGFLMSDDWRLGTCPECQAAIGRMCEAMYHNLQS